MIHYLYQKNICKDDKRVKSIIRFKTCEHCHTDLVGLWEFEENNLECYETFYDKRHGEFKSGYYVSPYADSARARTSSFYIDLNTLAIGEEFDNDNDISGIDITDVEAIKKLITFGVVWELTKAQIDSWESFGSKIEKCTDLNKLSENGKISKGHYYIDNSSLDEYLNYLKSEEYFKILELKKEIDEFKEIKKCPICNGNLSKSHSIDVFIPYDSTKSEILEICRKEIEEQTEPVKRDIFKTTAENFVSNILHNGIVANTKDKEICSTNDLKKYIKNLLSVEKIVLELSERLKAVYQEYYIAEKEVFVTEKIRSLEVLQKQHALQKEYENMLNSPFTPSTNIEDIQVKLPERPVEPIEPEKPVLKQPNFFNKRKVTEENEIINREYLKKLDDYQKAKEKYLSDMEIYRYTVNEIMQERKSKYEELVLKEKEQHQHQIEELKAKLDKTVANINSCGEIEKTQENTKYNLLKPEKDEVEELLVKAVKLRAELYSCDIVFEKYRDIVSISMFCEYLESGRCQELVGSNGAYNLYENEIRTNMIVSQLQQVVESLEQIKNNQFLIYSALQTMNDNLNRLNTSMNNAVKSLSNIEAGVDNIEKTAEVIAYNTERTAYYSQKNAELTNALGFMIALS